MSLVVLNLIIGYYILQKLACHTEKTEMADIYKTALSVLLTQEKLEWWNYRVQEM